MFFLNQKYMNMLHCRGPSCQSTIEVYDGLANDGAQPLKKICGPVTRHVRDHSGRYLCM